MTGQPALSTAHPPRLAGLQALRGVAALMVVLHHAIGSAEANGFGLPGLARGVAFNAGVDIFFVISGVVMELTAGAAQIARPGGAADFMRRRAARILPLYWALTLLAMGLAALAALLGVAIQAQLSPWLLLCSMLLLPASGAGGQAAYVIPMAWSLTYEMAFYLLFAGLLNARPGVRLGVLGAVFSAATLLGWRAAPEAPLWRMLTDPTLFEFLAGCGLAVLWRRGVRLGCGVCLGLVILGVGLLLAQWSRLPPWDVRLLGWGVPAVLVVAGCLLPDRPLRWRGLGVLTALGDRSYSLYLSHFFALALFVRLHRAAPLPDGLALLAMVALCLVVAELCWRSIERPAQRHFAR